MRETTVGQRGDKTSGQTTRASLIAPGMHSDHYAGIVSDSIQPLPGIQQVQTNIFAQRVTVRVGNRRLLQENGSDSAPLVKGELSKMIEAIRLSGATFRKIVQNLFWAWIYNGVAIPVAALGLLHPMTASSLSVIGNLMLLHRPKLGVKT